MSGIWFTIYNLCYNDVCSSEKKSVKPFLCLLSVSPCSSWPLKNFYISIFMQQKTTNGLHKIIMISVCPPDLSKNRSRIKEQKYTSNVWP